ncbi:MAG: 5'-methylthioadenosine/S-adenosylhomocysteine nucleosidase [Pseudomonadota bacterium]
MRKFFLTVLLLAVSVWQLPAQAASASPSSAVKPSVKCLSDCTPRIGIVSAFGAEADLLVAETRQRKTHSINGNVFTTGVLHGNRVVIVLSGVSMINSVMVTQLLLDHFRVERLIMSGIAGGLNPELHVGDVTIPDRWVMSMEVYWSHNSAVPAACGKPGDVSCLGLKLASGKDGQLFPPFTLPTPHGEVPTGLFMRENFVMTTKNASKKPQGEFVFAYPVDAEMLAVASQLKPKLSQCGPSAKPDQVPDPRLCVRQQPRLLVGGAGVTGTAFLAHPAYRKYLFQHLEANTFEMETAGLAHVAYANKVPYIAFRSLSDLAGGEEFDTDVAALFTSGLAEANEAAVTLAFLQAWRLKNPMANTTTTTTKPTGVRP